MLECGAVEGEVFHRGAVQALAPVDSKVTPRLASLVRKELIRADDSRFLGEDGFCFCHLLIRDAAYDALPKATRAELHERFAGWLDEQGSAPVEREEILGYHLEQAHRYRVELGSPTTRRARSVNAPPATWLRPGVGRSLAATSTPSPTCSSARSRSESANPNASGSRSSSATPSTRPDESRRPTPCWPWLTTATRLRRTRPRGAGDRLQLHGSDGEPASTSRSSRRCRSADRHVCRARRRARSRPGRAAARSRDRSPGSVGVRASPRSSGRSRARGGLGRLGRASTRDRNAHDAGLANGPIPVGEAIAAAKSCSARRSPTACSRRCSSASSVCSTRWPPASTRRSSSSVQSSLVLDELDQLTVSSIYRGPAAYAKELAGDSAGAEQELHAQWSCVPRRRLSRHRPTHDRGGQHHRDFYCDQGRWDEAERSRSIRADPVPRATSGLRSGSRSRRGSRPGAASMRRYPLAERAVALADAGTGRTLRAQIWPVVAEVRRAAGRTAEGEPAMAARDSSSTSRRGTSPR